MPTDNCFLCTNLDDRGGRLSLGDGLALTSDIAPLAEGHILLHSETHLGSSALLPSAKLPLWKDRIRALLDAPPFANRNILLFEHGTDGITKVDIGCTDHAHIHAMPVPHCNSPLTSATSAAKRLGSAAGPVITFEDLSAFAGKGYFWIADRELMLHTIAPDRPERQYLRRVISEAIGKASHQTWDTLNESSARATMDTWRAAMTPHQVKS